MGKGHFEVVVLQKGINLELQSEIACCDEGKSLINLAIRIDNLIRSQDV